MIFQDVFAALAITLLTICVSLFLSGEMDDVLDHFCSFHHCGSIYRYVSLLVSDLCPTSALLLMI